MLDFFGLKPDMYNSSPSPVFTVETIRKVILLISNVVFRFHATDSYAAVEMLEVMPSYQYQRHCIALPKSLNAMSRFLSLI